MELLPVSTVWGRRWYFIVLKLTGRRRRRREEENTKAEGEEVGNTADNVVCFLASLNGCFEWLRNDTRNFTKAEYVFQCIIIWLQCSDMDNYHNFKTPFNPLILSLSLFFCIKVISWIIKYYLLQDLEITRFVLLWFFFIIIIFYFASISTGCHCIFAGNNSLANNTAEDQNSSTPNPDARTKLSATAVPG